MLRARRGDSPQRKEATLTLVMRATQEFYAFVPLYLHFASSLGLQQRTEEQAKVQLPNTAIMKGLVPLHSFENVCGHEGDGHLERAGNRVARVSPSRGGEDTSESPGLWSQTGTTADVSWQPGGLPS